MVCEVHIIGEITEKKAHEWGREIMAGEDEWTRLIVSSAGGSVFGALHLLGVIQWEQLYHRRQFEAVVTGTCMSATPSIVAQCNRVIASPTSIWMFHAVGTSIDGRQTRNEFQSEVEYHDIIDASMTQPLFARAGSDFAGTYQWRLNQGVDWNLNAQEARKYGLIDKFIGE